MQDNQRFAQTINTNITKMFYDYMIYKVRMRENLNIAIKGECNSTTAESRAVGHQTRSGKSTVGLSIGNFISSMTRVPYTDFHICANESECCQCEIQPQDSPKYYSKVRNAKFNELYHNQAIQEGWNADGNRRAERVQRLLTVGQIRRRVVQGGNGNNGYSNRWITLKTAIKREIYHSKTVCPYYSLIMAVKWIYPSDFIARNSVYGLETYGKELKNKLIRCLVYDVRKTMMGLATPLGYIIVGKIQDPKYQQLPEDKWTKYRLENKYKLVRSDFDSMLEEKYEQTCISLNPN